MNVTQTLTLCQLRLQTPNILELPFQRSRKQICLRRRCQGHFNLVNWFRATKFIEMCKLCLCFLLRRSSSCPESFWTLFKKCHPHILGPNCDYCIMLGWRMLWIQCQLLASLEISGFASTCLTSTLLQLASQLPNRPWWICVSISLPWNKQSWCCARKF